jgi:uncharacterized protein with GYD domain
MPMYLMLSTLGPEGMATLRQNPERLKEVNSEVEAMGVRVVSQWALLGPYDFATILEAPDELVVARVAVTLGARGTLKTKTLTAIPIDEFIGAVGRLLRDVDQYHHMPVLWRWARTSSFVNTSGRTLSSESRRIRYPSFTRSATSNPELQAPTYRLRTSTAVPVASLSLVVALDASKAVLTIRHSSRNTADRQDPRAAHRASGVMRRALGRVPGRHLP